jgi:hypothetical protein
MQSILCIGRCGQGGLEPAGRFCTGEAWATWALTALTHGDYCRTYAQRVEDEVRAMLAAPADFERGLPPLARDSLAKPERGFTDGSYLFARWPGDAHRFALEFAGMVGPQLQITAFVAHDKLLGALLD